MSPSSLLHLTLVQALQGLKKKEFSAKELTQTYLQKIDEKKDLNIYITVCHEQALRQAQESDDRLARSQAGALEGIPLGIKDAFCTKGILTTAGSKILYNFVPPYESTVTQKMLDQGAVFLGKLNLDQFCMGSTSTTSFTGAVRNPLDPSCVTGGSSGGSAAAVSGTLALASLGTDTGGSIRQPAAFCGVVGVKPTYGRCSRFGITALASSLDQAGPLGRTVEDTAYLLNYMCGRDARDSTSVETASGTDFCKLLGKSVKGMKVGIPLELYNQSAGDEFFSVWHQSRDVFEKAGCEVKMVSLPYAPYALPCYYILMCAQAASNLQRYDGVRYGLRVDAETMEESYCRTRGEGFGAEVKRRILMGTYILSKGYYDSYYGKAQRICQILSQDFQRVFQEVDVLLMPTTPTTAFPLDKMPTDPVEVYLNDVLTVPANIGNICGISVPVPSPLGAGKLPWGMQILAPAFGEEKMFQFASVLEQELGYKNPHFHF
ncbi:MAG: aspartyl/glutamyl-tRNA amidotransferase subunit A [Alphaproteobacteria bacterium 40-19]|nr:MAG: aspartyl/glutamyl-tRNA amidotransferase subunit A [Alphaproteobacteria bacterium 40-19]